MKTFQFKIKSYDNEEGEYSAWQTAESGTIIQFILSHWFNETLPNNLDIIAIKNSSGDLLVLDHERKDAFRYFFIRKDEGRPYYYKMTDITFMFFTLESFFNNLPDDLINNMNKTTDDWRWVKSDFLGKNFHYKLRPWQLIRHFTNLAIGALIWLGAFNALVVVALSKNPDSVTLIVLVVVLLFLTLLGWIARHRIIWYLDQRDWVLTLSRGDRFMHVSFKGHKKSIPKSDIVSIHEYFGRDNDGWWPIYCEICFNNGCVFNITNLIMPQELIKEKFHFEMPLYKELHTGGRRLKKRTNMAAYYPDALNRNYIR